MSFIFVDLDGVLADFSAGACALFKCAPPSIKDGKKDLHDIIGIDRGRLWARIEEEGRGFWSHLPATEWANELVDLISSKGEMIIATSPSFSPNSASGKLFWIQKKFGRRFRDYVICPRKELLASNGRFLIDDTQKNVEAFKSAGGNALLYPTLMNGELLEGMNPLNIVEKFLNQTA